MRRDNILEDVPSYQKALVAFSGQTDLPWLRLFRAGFRHCFVVVSDGASWISIDPLSHRTEVRLLPVPADFDLAAYYEGEGLTVVAVEPRAVRRRPAPVAPHSCVEAVKRVLGIHRRTIVSPHQLYRFLVATARGHDSAGGEVDGSKKKYLDIGKSSPMFMRAAATLRRLARRGPPFARPIREMFHMGLFSSPKAPQPPPLPVIKAPNPDDEKRKARLEAIERRRRGRAGTVQTSARGVLGERGTRTGRKTLLGE